MRHGKKIAKLGRTASHRKAMLSNMMMSLFANERITTTQIRAKALRRTAEKVITFAKKGDLHARRQVLRVIADKQIVSKLFDELGPRYKSRNGGYTRVVKLGPRRGDGAFMSIIELVDRPGAAAAEPAEEQATSAEAQESTEK
ncbi:MAG: 50S ribosomal protein L17 [Gemmatimonadetes bacterium]|jgi:large subunit ribosomal protein L17|nr:50S ribosomal protein L17 [Gemmatimonadota bacterium]MBT5325868.1 50S ribosomal protein L17 [Gemmatimonadota bacterium]MBT5449111.1 50S ribosomal protein L17 [Gemmatimonadota bacterium]MBT5804590.1 50S ribosomal protein L17 [Gemmatimonadota bacterium]MBT6622823.1 50S ribosomal protein L17 [Gemmatimonadota bacterium]